MMERGLKRCAGCLLKLDPGHNAPSRYMQVTFTVHTYHLTIRLRRVHRVLRVEPLGELCSRSDRKTLQFHYYDIMRHIALLPHDIWCLTSSFYPLRSPQTDPLIDPVALDMCNTARNFTHQSNTCVIRRLAFLNLGFIEQMSSLPPFLAFTKR